MEFLKDSFAALPQTDSPLHILIIGAGVAGLTAAIGLARAGHTITLLEQSRSFSEVGAGIQLAPNATRILARFGVLEAVLQHATLLECNSLRRYADDSELGSVPFMPALGHLYGAPALVIHRGDLQAVLLRAAAWETGIIIRTDAKVMDVVDGFEASVRLEDGECLKGDLVIAGDGLKSGMRAQMMRKIGAKNGSHHTGDAAYRVLLPREVLSGDNEALALLNSKMAIRWMGPGAHVMAYPVSNHQVLNMVLVHPERPRTASSAQREDPWNNIVSKVTVLDTYRDWNPLLKRLLSYVPEGNVVEWVLHSHDKLPSWCEGKVVLMGDACHPMLPYVAQGAAQAIEDAGVLSLLLGRTSDIPTVFRLYTALRKRRAESIQQSAVTTRQNLHLPDGKEQVERDRQFGRVTCSKAKIEDGRERGTGNGDEESNPDMWADRAWQAFMYGVDVMKEAENMLEMEEAAKVEDRLREVKLSTSII